MHNKIKLCLAIPTHVGDNKFWSGTHDTLYKYLSSREDVELSVLEYPYRETLFWRFFYSKICRFFFTWSGPQDFIVRGLVNRMIKKELSCKTDDIDFYLFPGTPCSLGDSEKLKGKLCVYTDSLMSDLNRYRPYRPFKLLSSFYYKCNMRKDIAACSLVFTQNEWSKRRLCEISGLNGGNAFNIHFGINVNYYEGTKNYNKKLMLIVLRKGMENTKGLTLLLKAMPKIREIMPDVRLAVVGTNIGSGMDGVTCYYNQPRSVTIDLFRKSTLYVMAARNEPNGITYLEALANKTPIVGLNRFSFPEFCNHGEFGFISPQSTPNSLAKTIIEAFSDTRRLETMGKKGQEYVMGTFKWEKTIEDMIKIMKESCSMYPTKYKKL